MGWGTPGVAARLQLRRLMRARAQELVECPGEGARQRSQDEHEDAHERREEGGEGQLVGARAEGLVRVRVGVGVRARARARARALGLGLGLGIGIGVGLGLAQVVEHLRQHLAEGEDGRGGDDDGEPIGQKLVEEDRQGLGRANVEEEQRHEQPPRLLDQRS